MREQPRNADSLAIRRATPDDTADIVALLRVAMPGAAELHDPDFWRWKHVHAPFGPSLVMVAAPVDAPAAPPVVGVRVFLRKRWWSNGTAVDALRAVDTATHPDWQRRGIFERLNTALVAAAEAEGVPFIFNTPNDKSRAGNLKLGWRDVGRVGVRAFPLRPASLAMHAALAARGTPRIVPPLDDDASVDALCRDPRLTAVLARLDATDDPRLHTRVDVPYLRWRYRDIPRYTYLARSRFDGDHGAFVIARRRERRGIDELTLAELAASPGPEGRRLLRQAILDLVDNTPCELVTALAAPGTNELAGLRSLGFMAAPPALGPVLTLRRLGPTLPAGCPDPARLSAWRVGIGDLEIL